MSFAHDEFAMAALTGLLAYPGTEQTGNWNNNANPSDVATQAYTLADAMMEKRRQA